MIRAVVDRSLDLNSFPFPLARRRWYTLSAAHRGQRSFILFEYPRHMKRNASRRSFTVEVKSTDRRHAVNIPSKLPDPPPKHRSAAALFRQQPVVAVVEPRRILPNLIVPEAPQDEPEPAEAQTERLPRVRRLKLCQS